MFDVLPLLLKLDEPVWQLHLNRRARIFPHCALNFLDCVKDALPGGASTLVDCVLFNDSL